MSPSITVDAVSHVFLHPPRRTRNSTLSRSGRRSNRNRSRQDFDLLLLRRSRSWRLRRVLRAACTARTRSPHDTQCARGFFPSRPRHQITPRSNADVTESCTSRIRIKRGRRHEHQPVHASPPSAPQGRCPHGRLGLNVRSVYPEESRSFRRSSIKLSPLWPRFSAAAFGRFPAPRGVPRRRAGRNAFVPAGCCPRVGESHDSARPFHT